MKMEPTFTKFLIFIILLSTIFIGCDTNSIKTANTTNIEPIHENAINDNVIADKDQKEQTSNFLRSVEKFQNDVKNIKKTLKNKTPSYEQFIATSKDDLSDLINRYTTTLATNPDSPTLEILKQQIINADVSNVTDMSGLFKNQTTFNLDISNWDVSNVTNMKKMFYKASKFNQDISNWDTSSVINMDKMFYKAYSFNQDISSWDVSNVTNMHKMFYKAYSFNQDLSRWDISNVIDMDKILYKTSSFSQNSFDIES